MPKIPWTVKTPSVATPGNGVLSFSLSVLVILMSLFLLHSWNQSQTNNDGELKHINYVVVQGLRTIIRQNQHDLQSMALRLSHLPDSRFLQDGEDILRNYVDMMSDISAVAFVTRQDGYVIQASDGDTELPQLGLYPELFTRADQTQSLTDAPAFWSDSRQQWLLPIIYPVKRPAAGYSGYLISMYDLNNRMQGWDSAHQNDGTSIVIAGKDALPRYGVPDLNRYRTDSSKKFLRKVVQKVLDRAESEGAVTVSWPAENNQRQAESCRVFYKRLNDDLISLVVRPVSVFYQNYWNSVQLAMVLFTGLVLSVIVLNHLVIRQNSRHRHELEYKAHHDPLTGLLNRSYLLQLINEEIDEYPENQLTFILINIDHFNRINDQYGHSVGDRILCSMAERIRRLVPDYDRLGRAGGDEFMILLRSGKNPSSQDVLIMALMASLHESYQVEQRNVRVSVSVGVAEYPGDASRADNLLGKADAALHRAKADGRAQVVHYSSDIALQQQREKRMEKALDGAWNRGEITVVYQPQVDCRHGEIRGAEALVRWNSPEFGQVPPDEFIPLAEATGLVADIDRYVLREACTFIKNLSDTRQAPLLISVNLSAYHLLEPSMIGDVTNLLDEIDLNPEQLVLEVTETAMLNDFERAAQQLSQLRALGIGVSVDDFGTGYSSLSYIHRLPVTEIKIDRSFIEKIDTDLHDRTLISAIIAMGRRLNLDVVAEGVEAENQWQILKHHKCDVLQGYYIAKPLTQPQFLEFVDENELRKKAFG